MFGGLDDDLVFGNRGNDLVFGDAGNDTLFGGLDADTLAGGAGDDLVFGDGGADVFVLQAGGGSDTAADFSLSGGDRIGIAAGVGYTVTGGAGNAVITLSDQSRITLTGVAGDAVSAIYFLSVAG